MPKDISQFELTSQDRLREVASILTRGVARWRKQVKSGRTMPVSAPPESSETGLATCSKTSLSVSRTHGLHLRDDGDVA